MSSDEEVERFEVTERDLQDAFYPGSRRKFTKEQAIYGMWADKDYDDDRSSSSRTKRKADYTSGLDFVSGGFTQKQEGEDDEEDEDKGLIK